MFERANNYGKKKKPNNMFVSVLHPSNEKDADGWAGIAKKRLDFVLVTDRPTNRHSKS